MITPTVGRIVHYTDLGQEGQPPMAAIITAVHGDTCVNLAIFNHVGEPMLKPPRSVLLVQEGVEKPAAGPFCEWMPYQVKKTTGSESGEREAGTQDI